MKSEKSYPEIKKIRIAKIYWENSLKNTIFAEKLASYGNHVALKIGK